MSTTTSPLLPALAALLLAVAAAGCAGLAPGSREPARGLVTGAGFDHVTFGEAPAGAPRLRVYLAGDGRAWLGRNRVAVDPTPRRAPILALLRQDPGPALLLGRPCYHGLHAAPGCHPRLWTHARYGETVVASMTAALERLAGGAGIGRITLIGYSGGGALAALIAPRVPAVDVVVTVAGNLDPAGWAREHGYSPLADSLAPVGAPPLPPRIAQLHLAGAADREVPPRLVRAYAARQHQARVRVIPGFDHGCCWRRAWPALLGEVARLEATRAGGTGRRDPAPAGTGGSPPGDLRAPPAGPA